MLNIRERLFRFQEQLAKFSGIVNHFKALGEEIEEALEEIELWDEESPMSLLTPSCSNQKALT